MAAGQQQSTASLLRLRFMPSLSTRLRRPASRAVLYLLICPLVSSPVLTASYLIYRYYMFPYLQYKHNKENFLPGFRASFTAFFFRAQVQTNIYSGEVPDQSRGVPYYVYETRVSKNKDATCKGRNKKAKSVKGKKWQT